MVQVEVLHPVLLWLELGLVLGTEDHVYATAPRSITKRRRGRRHPGLRFPIG